MVMTRGNWARTHSVGAFAEQGIRRIASKEAERILTEQYRYTCDSAYFLKFSRIACQP